MNYRMIQLASIALVCLLPLGSASAENNNNVSQDVRKDEFLSLLLHGQYQELDRELQALQNAYKADRSREDAIHRAFYQFYRGDPRLKAALDSWVKQDSHSAIPYLARGIFRTKVGWVIRGSGWASETPAFRFGGMDVWFDAAKRDLLHAEQIDPSLVEPYCYLIEIDMNQGGKMTRTWYRRALKVNPWSFVAREFYLHSELPRWGGSYEAMSRTVAESRPYYGKMPELRVLEGRADADRAEIAESQGDYTAAIRYLDRALTNGDFWVYNYDKGKVLYDTHDYAGAVREFTKVIRYKPGYKRAWWRRAQAYGMVDNYHMAIADINRAIDIEPYDDAAISVRGYIFQAKGDLNAALSDFRRAAVLNPSSREHQREIRAVTQLMSHTM